MSIYTLGRLFRLRIFIGAVPPNKRKVKRKIIDSRHGVVVSHLLNTEKVVGSNPTVYSFFFQVN